MSNAWINWRFAYWHLQITKDRPFVRVSYNDWHVGKLGKASPWIEFY